MGKNSKINTRLNQIESIGGIIGMREAILLRIVRKNDYIILRK